METAGAPEVSAPVETSPETPTDAPIEGGEVEAKPPTAAEIRKWKLKVNGAEEEVDEPELIKRAQLSSSANQKFQKAAEIEKMAQEMLRELESDPRHLFEKTKKDPYEWAEKLLIEKLKYETASPEQRRLWDLENENLSLKERAQLAEKYEAEKKAADEKSRYDSVVEQESVTFDKGIADAIRNAGIKQPTPALVRRMAEKMLVQFEHNPSSVNAETALKAVRSELKTQNLELLEAFPDEELENLPKSFVEKLRKMMISKVQSQPGVGQQQQQRSNEATRSSGAPRTKSSTDQFFARLDKKYG